MKKSSPVSGKFVFRVTNFSYMLMSPGEHFSIFYKFNKFDFNTVYCVQCWRKETRQILRRVPQNNHCNLLVFSVKVFVRIGEVFLEHNIKDL